MVDGVTVLLYVSYGLLSIVNSRHSISNCHHWFLYWRLHWTGPSLILWWVTGGLPQDSFSDRGLYLVDVISVIHQGWPMQHALYRVPLAARTQVHSIWTAAADGAARSERHWRLTQITSAVASTVGLIFDNIAELCWHLVNNDTLTTWQQRGLLTIQRITGVRGSTLALIVNELAWRTMKHNEYRSFLKNLLWPKGSRM